MGPLFLILFLPVTPAPRFALSRIRALSGRSCGRLPSRARAIQIPPDLFGTPFLHSNPLRVSRSFPYSARPEGARPLFDLCWPCVFFFS